MVSQFESQFNMPSSVDDSEDHVEVNADESLTAVVFRRWKQNVTDYYSIIALFPEVPSDLEGKYCLSYEHFGQHGAANYSGVLKTTVTATEDEYAELKRELESAPYYYKLKVFKRMTKLHREQFLETLRKEQREINA